MDSGSSFAAALRNLARQAGNPSQSAAGPPGGGPDRHAFGRDHSAPKLHNAALSHAPVVTISPTMNLSASRDSMPGRLPGLPASQVHLNPAIMEAQMLMMAGGMNSDVLQLMPSGSLNSSSNIHAGLLQQQQLAMMSQYKAMEAAVTMQQMANMNSMNPAANLRNDSQTRMIMEQYRHAMSYQMLGDMLPGHGLLPGMPAAIPNALLHNEDKLRQQMVQQQAMMQHHAQPFKPRFSIPGTILKTPPPPAYNGTKPQTSERSLLTHCLENKCKTLDNLTVPRATATSDQITFRPYSDVGGKKPDYVSPPKLYRPFDVESCTSTAESRCDSGQSLACQTTDGSHPDEGRSIIDYRVAACKSGNEDNACEEDSWQKLLVIKTCWPMEPDNTAEKFKVLASLRLCTKKRQSDIKYNQNCKKRKFFMEEEEQMLYEDDTQECEQSLPASELSAGEQPSRNIDSLITSLKLQPTTAAQRESNARLIALCEREKRNRSKRRKPVDQIGYSTANTVVSEGSINSQLVSSTAVIDGIKSVRVEPIFKTSQRTSNEKPRAQAVVAPKAKVSSLSSHSSAAAHHLSPDFAQQFHDSVFKETFSRTPEKFDPAHLLRREHNRPTSSQTSSLQWPGMEILMQAYQQHMQSRF